MGDRPRRRQGDQPLPEQQHIRPVSDSHGRQNTIADPPDAHRLALGLARPLVPSSIPVEVQNTRSKVSIPRDNLTAARLSTRTRTKRACEECRKRRVKCDGGQPGCQQCKETSSKCTYSESKRVQETRQLHSLRSTVKQYESLLRDLAHEVPNNTAKIIRTTLTHNRRDIFAGGRPESHSSSSSPASLQGIDTVDEDVNSNQESRATGFVGKNSVTSWLRHLDLNNGPRSEADEDDDHMNPQQYLASLPSNEDSLTTRGYFLDDHQISNPDLVDSYGLPPKQLADRLLSSYFRSVHANFPIVRGKLFLEQYRNLYGSHLARPGKKWLAILNLTFAIGCRRLQFLQGPLPHGIDVVFFSRARLLSANENISYEHADLQQVQVEALVALYLLVSAQINRAWNISGVAVRSAMALAINLRNTTKQLHRVSKDARCRLWWSIFLLENLLSHMTGRPNCIGNASFSVDPPVPFDEELFGHPEVMGLFQSGSLRKEFLTWSLDDDSDQANPQPSWLKEIQQNSGLYFFYLIDLNVITHAAINEVFSPAVLGISMTYIKRRIQFYEEKIDRWLSRIHPAFKFLDDHSNTCLDQLCKEQVVLALHHYSARITLYRPCFLHRKSISLKDIDSGSLTAKCLHAAVALISIFPDNVDLRRVYHTSPWWCILDFLMQATTILMIYTQVERDAIASTEQPYSRPVKEGELPEIQKASRKAYEWLHGLSNVDESCRRAFQLYDDLAQRSGLDLCSAATGATSLQAAPSSTQYHDATGSSGFHPKNPGIQPRMESDARYQFNGDSYIWGEHHDLSADGITSAFPDDDEQMPDALPAATTSLDGNALGSSAWTYLSVPEGTQGRIPALTQDLMTDNYSQWLSTALGTAESPIETDPVIN